jgi:cobaltochelatase CobS
MNISDRVKGLTFRNMYGLAREAIKPGTLGFNPHQRFTGSGMKMQFAAWILANIPESKIAPHLEQYEKASNAAREHIAVKTGKPVPTYTPTKESATVEQTSDVASIIAEATGTTPTAQPEAASAAHTAGNGDEADQIAAALRAIMAQGRNVNPEQVIAICKAQIDEALSKIGAMPVRVQLVNQAGEARNLEGVHHKQFPDLLRALQVKDASGMVYPVWLPGPAGSGKTTAARNAAKELGRAFYFTGAVLNKYELLGFRDAGGNVAHTAFRLAYEQGGLFLWDEVDASAADALVAMNAAIENGVCAFPDGNVAMHPDFICIAAANTYGSGATHEYVGRTKLDASTVDRFVMLEWDYDEALEIALAGNVTWTRKVQEIRRAVRAAGIKHVVSPRASMRGAAYLAAGFTEAQVLNMCVYKGLSAEQQRTITANVR